jgi:hypothetical protein
MDKHFIIHYSCVIEALTGLGLIFFPVKLISLIFGSSLTESPGIAVSMVAGVAILSLSLIWWQLRLTSFSIVFRSMFFYNSLISVILIYILMIYRITGPVIWIIIIFHLLQSLLSATQLNRKLATDK